MPNFKRQVNKNAQKQQQEKNNEQEIQLKEPEFIRHCFTRFDENDTLLSNCDNKQDE